MDLIVSDGRIYALDDRVTQENAHAKAEELKTKAFGRISGILFGAKKEDIEVTCVEKRYEPFWHILCKTHIEYERDREYPIILDHAVRKVTIDGIEHDVANRLTLHGIEYCVEELEKEVFIDAVTGRVIKCSKHMGYDKKEIKETEELMKDDIIVVPAKVKASILTRNMVREMLAPVDADEIMVEKIEIEKLHLYFKPVYAFEYFWKPKNKTSILELDAVTLEVKSGGKALRQRMGEVLSEADLFEMGTDAVDIFIPGGGIALRLTKKVIEKKRK